MEQVIQVNERLDETRLWQSTTERVVLDLSSCATLSTPCQERLRTMFSTLLNSGVDLRVRGGSPEVQAQCRHLRAQALMRSAERKNPRLFSQAG